MKLLLGIFVVVLIVLHQDFWQWDNAELVWGFMPYALLYHMGISLAASAMWLWATRYVWPPDEEVLADEAAVTTSTRESNRA